MKIIIDAMGGDNAPEQIVKGAFKALADFDFELILVGDESKIQKYIDELKSEELKSKITVVNCQKCISMNDEPTSIIHENRDSSMGVALDMLAKNEADALISAGNSGALLCGSTLIVKRIDGVKRPAFAATLPLGRKLLIDSGANNEVKPEYLVQFATMGSLYMKCIYGVATPKVALLNIGTEENKGTPLYREAYTLLSDNKNIDFVGNIEGRELTSDFCDVVVCDGFSGNIALKTMEGVGRTLKNEIKGLYEGPLGALSYLLIRKKVKKLADMFDYRVHGGAPILGVNKTVVKAHGSSNEKAIYYTVKQVLKLVKNDIIGKVRMSSNIAVSEGEL